MALSLGESKTFGCQQRIAPVGLVGSIEIGMSIGGLIAEAARVDSIRRVRNNAAEGFSGEFSEMFSTISSKQGVRIITRLRLLGQLCIAFTLFLLAKDFHGLADIGGCGDVWVGEMVGEEDVVTDLLHSVAYGLVVAKDLSSSVP